MTVTVNQLPDSPPTFVVLHCARCGNDYSANRGDYFLTPPNKPMRCECRAKLFITTRKTVYDHDNGQKWLQDNEEQS